MDEAIETSSEILNLEVQTRAIESETSINSEKQVRACEFFGSTNKHLENTRPKNPSRTILMPVYNEEHRIEQSLSAVLSILDSDTELIIIDDGSSDRTPELIADANNHPMAKIIRLDSNSGKGAAIRAGVRNAAGRNVIFMDADIATDLSDLAIATPLLETHDVVIGSRAIEGTVMSDATAIRTRMGGMFNYLTRSITGLPYRDTQCGFKSFRAPVARLLFGPMEISRFAFDVEVLQCALKLGLSVTEMPVRWTEMPGSKVRVVRDSCRMALDLIHIRRLNETLTAVNIETGNETNCDFGSFLSDNCISFDGLQRNDRGIDILFGFDDDPNILKTKDLLTNSNIPLIRNCSIERRLINDVCVQVMCGNPVTFQHNDA